MTTAGSEPFIGPEPSLPISYSMIKSSIGNWADKQPDVYWELMNTCRQTKMFLEHRSKARSRELLNLHWNLLRTVTGIITGHNIISRHINIMGLNNIFIMKTCTRHSRLENINEYKNTQLYKPIQYTHRPSTTYLLTRNAADEHVNLISIKIKRICSITNKQEFQ